MAMNIEDGTVTVQEGAISSVMQSNASLGRSQDTYQEEVSPK
jgi:hypothetical protein